MPVLANLGDDPAAAERRAAQEDPWVMYLVVPRNVSLTLEQSLRLAAHATLECRRRFADDPRHRDDFAEWERRSFRKVTLKARPGQWRELLDSLDCAVVEEPGGAAVACLPPCLRSQRDPLLGRMQAHSGAEEALARAGDDHRAELVVPEDAALFVLPAEREMSAGKLMAQVGHAAIMLDMAAPLDGVAAWREAGWPCAFGEADAPTWAALAERCDGVVVRDAGLTEIEPGTETVMALAPGQRVLDVLEQHPGAVTLTHPS
jgi:peptidyl-tRNA hydrolase